MDKISIEKIKGYVGIANRAGYIIFGADNLKGYSHKLYIVIYREDYGNSIIKVVNNLKQNSKPCFKLSIDDFNKIIGQENCKLFAIKNKGISEQIEKILRSEDISG